jgi:transcriptional regulator with XRE-family HTH domain
MSIVAKRLREARLKAGLSQERLGVLAGIDEMSASARMNQYERGKHVPDISIVEKLAEVLNLPSAFFYAADDDVAQLLCHFHRLPDSDKKRFLSMIAAAESDL